MAKEFRIPFSRLRVDRFLFLLISILLFFVMRPFLEGFIGIRMLLDILFSVILFSAILAISQKNYHLIIGLFIALPVFVIRWSTYFVKSPPLILVGHGFMILFFAYTMVILLS